MWSKADQREKEAMCESFGRKMIEELIAGTDFQLSRKAAINLLVAAPVHQDQIKL